VLANPLVALAPCDHPLAREKRIAFERFAREPLLVREHGSGTRLAAEQLFARHGARPRIAMELGSSESIKEAMLAGLGVAVLHRYALGFDVEAQRLCLLDVEGLPAEGHLHVIHASGRHVPAVARAFVDFAMHEAKAIFDARERAGLRSDPLSASPRVEADRPVSGMAASRRDDHIARTN
jgi:DNA-binding transcriptional LysR family regulator